jgi:hypothetical protein
MDPPVELGRPVRDFDASLRWRAEPGLTPGTILGSAETHLLITRLTGWDLDAYQTG